VLPNENSPSKVLSCTEHELNSHVHVIHKYVTAGTSLRGQPSCNGTLCMGSFTEQADPSQLSLLINASVATLRGLESNCGFRGASVSTAPCDGGNFRCPCVASPLRPAGLAVAAVHTGDRPCCSRRQCYTGVESRKWESEGAGPALPTPPACGDTVLWGCAVECDVGRWHTRVATPRSASRAPALLPGAWSHSRGQGVQGQGQDERRDEDPTGGPRRGPKQQERACSRLTAGGPPTGHPFQLWIPS